MQSLEKKLRAAVIEHTVRVSIMKALNLSEDKYDQITMETRFAEDLDSDSLEEAEMVMSIEELHDLDEIPEEYARSAKQFKHVYDYVLEHCKKDITELVNFDKKDHYSHKMLSRIEEQFALSPENSIMACTNMHELIERFNSASAAMGA